MQTISFAIETLFTMMFKEFTNKFKGMYNNAFHASKIILAMPIWSVMENACLHRLFTAFSILKQSMAFAGIFALCPCMNLTCTLLFHCQGVVALLAEDCIVTYPSSQARASSPSVTQDEKNRPENVKWPGVGYNKQWIVLRHRSSASC